MLNFKILLDRFKKSSLKPSSAPKILAADLWAVFNFANPNVRYQRFLQRGRPALKRLVDSLLLHEQIVVPTQDFLSLTILVGVLGEKPVLDLLESKCLRFLRFKGAFSYIGNGGGFKSYQIMLKDNSPGECDRPISEAVQIALEGAAVKVKEKDKFARLIRESREITSSSVCEKIKHETYMDILKSPYLRNCFALSGNKDMDRLKGIKPNQVRIYGGPDADHVGDEIDTVMALGAANLELRLAEIEGCNDSATADSIGHLIKAKAQRAFNTEASESFLTFSEIAGIPDIGEGILEKKISIKELLKLRNSKNGIQFRNWFHENCRKDSVKTGHEFALLLRKEPFIQSLPSRVIRFFATTTISSAVVAPFLGVTATGVGVATGVIDSFFLDHWLKGTSPKYFIENLTRLKDNSKK